MSGATVYAYGDGNPISNMDPDGKFAVPALALAPPLAVSFAVGTIAGGLIYNQYGVWIQDTLDDITGRTAAWDEIQKDLDNKSYHRACDREPPTNLNPCDKGRWRYRQALKCQRLRQDWELRWGTAQSAPVHQAALDQVKNRLKNAASDIAKYCCQK